MNNQVAWSRAPCLYSRIFVLFKNLCLCSSADFLILSWAALRSGSRISPVSPWQCAALVKLLSWFSVLDDYSPTLLLSAAETMLPQIFRCPSLLCVKPVVAWTCIKFGKCALVFHHLLPLLSDELYLSQQAELCWVYLIMWLNVCLQRVLPSS